MVLFILIIQSYRVTNEFTIVYGDVVQFQGARNSGGIVFDYQSFAQYCSKEGLNLTKIYMDACLKFHLTMDLTSANSTPLPQIYSIVKLAEIDQVEFKSIGILPRLVCKYNSN